MSRTTKGETQRILLMDDEPIVRDVTTTVLEKSGFTVSKTSTGNEAVTAFRMARDLGLSFHVVLLDLHVSSGMGGTETIKALKAIDPSVRAILMTGDKSDPLFREFEAHGFCGALAKPFGVRHLLDSIFYAGHPRANQSHEPKYHSAAYSPHF